MVKFFLLFFRPIKRFLAQCIAVSTEPRAFVRERIRLGDTTNFLRAAGFFLSAISSAFLAEVATLHVLGIGGLTEPYYWLFILLTSIPFVLLAFVLVRLVAPLSFKDVLHLSLYPIGTGVFAGAAFALVASGVVGLLVAIGYLDEIKYDVSQIGNDDQVIAVLRRAKQDCLKEASLMYTILATGLQEAYVDLKHPFDELSWLRPAIAVLYLGIAASVFMAAVIHRKWLVFALVLFAAVAATGANFLSLAYYIDWSSTRSSCEDEKNLAKLGLARMAESALVEFAAKLNQRKGTDLWDDSVRAEGRTLVFTYRFKRPIEMGLLHRVVSRWQKHNLEGHCAERTGWYLRGLNATQTHTFYGPEGEWLTSFSIGPADCPKW